MRSCSQRSAHWRSVTRSKTPSRFVADTYTRVRLVLQIFCRYVASIERFDKRRACFAPRRTHRPSRRVVESRSRSSTPAPGGLGYLACWRYACGCRRQAEIGLRHGDAEAIGSDKRAARNRSIGHQCSVHGRCRFSTTLGRGAGSANRAVRARLFIRTLDAVERCGRW